MKKHYCRIRKDLVEQQIGVPIGTGMKSRYVFEKDVKKFEYRWRDNDNIFEVFYEEDWKEAYSIDFDFIN